MALPLNRLPAEPVFEALAGALAARCGAAPGRRVGHIGASPPLRCILRASPRLSAAFHRGLPDGSRKQQMTRHVGGLPPELFHLGVELFVGGVLRNEVVVLDLVGLVEERGAGLLLAHLEIPLHLLEAVLDTLVRGHEREALLLLLLLALNVGLAATLDKLGELLLELLFPPLGFLCPSAKVAYFIGCGSLASTYIAARFLRLTAGFIWAIAGIDGFIAISVLAFGFVPIWELIVGIFDIIFLRPFIDYPLDRIEIVARRTGIANT